MAADHPRGRRIFNVVKSSQFAVHGPSQQPAVSSLDAPKLFKMPLTRESGPTTRESRGEMHPVEAGSRRQHGPNILASTVGGLEGFNRLDNENHTAQNGSDSRFFSVPTGPKRFLDQPVASRNSNISRNQQSSPSFSKPVESATLETQPTTRGALASSHEDTADLPSRLLSRRQPRDLRGRSSTPFVTHDGENDAGDHAPVDYAVFQSLLVAQSKKDKIMKEQDEELLQLEQEVQELQGQNSKLLSEIDRVKNETKSYIQNCKKMVQATQEDAKRFQTASQEAYQKCIDEVQERIRDFQGSRDDLRDKVQDVEALLEQEQHHRSEIGPDLLRALESSKHEADFLRDKLFDVTNTLSEAKARATDLEGTISEENTSLKHTLKLLEASKLDLQRQIEHAIQYREEVIRLTEVEKQLRDKLQSGIEEMKILTQAKSASDKELGLKGIEIARLHDELRNREEKVSSMEPLPDEILQLRESLHKKDNEVVALQSKQAAAVEQIEELHQQLAQDKGLKERLEQTLRSYNALEAQQKEHLLACTEQKSRLQQTEQDLKTLQAQHNQVRIRLEAASINLQKKELDFDEQTVVLRETKRQMIDLQNEVAEAQKELKKLQASSNLQHEKDLHERKVLQNLVDQRTADVQKLSHELSDVKSERIRLEFQRDAGASEKHELQARFDQLKYDAHHEKATLQENLNSAEKQLEAANASLKELRQRINEQKLEIDTTLNAKTLSTEKTALAEEIKALKDKLFNASQLAEQDKMLKDANIESHLKEISRLSALHHEAEQAIAVARAESDQMTIRIAQLENQVSQQTETAGLRALEIQQANDRWLLMETRMETMASDMLDAKLTIKQTAELTAQAANTSNASNNEATESGEASMVLPEGQIAIDPSTLDALNSKITDLTNELDILQNRNSHLEASATTMVERHRKGELTTEENDLVIYVVQSTMQVNQKELVQKSNELKRREMICHTLHNRVKELEKQLASQLKVKQQNHQHDHQHDGVQKIFSYSDIMQTSSPLSDLPAVQGQQPLGDEAPRDPVQYAEQEVTITPSRLVKAGIESNGSGLDPTSGSVIAGHQERRLFANLNREKSDEAYDLFRNSDKSPVALEALPKAAPQAQAQSPAPPPQVQARSNGAGIKRRREEDERVEKTSITTRATRKQRLSNSHLGGQASNGSTAAEAKTNARGVKRLGGNGGLGGTGEGASGAIAKYKAQRNKQR